MSLIHLNKLILIGPSLICYNNTLFFLVLVSLQKHYHYFIKKYLPCPFSFFHFSPNIRVFNEYVFYILILFHQNIWTYLPYLWHMYTLGKHNFYMLSSCQKHVKFSRIQKLFKYFSCSPYRLLTASMSLVQPRSNLLTQLGWHTPEIYINISLC